MKMTWFTQAGLGQRVMVALNIGIVVVRKRGETDDVGPRVSPRKRTF